MDAQRKNPWKILYRLAIAALTTLAIAGLWQGYGAWLFGWVNAHGS